ncbi:MAG: ATP-binding protein, partial [Methylococcaceae bacterium]|nr:ATP-binding protein [Methylococcaceae bacterium]
YTNEWPPHLPKPDPARRYVPLSYRLMLLASDKSMIFGRKESVDRLSLNPIRVKGRTVGYVGVLPGPALNELGEIQFLERQGKSFVIIAVLMVLFSAGLALPLAHTLVRPLGRITAASKSLALGHYEVRVPVQSDDELGRLARDFNELARALGKTEQNRRQWVADISHELRTPLSVLRGELEALQDGVRPLERAAIDSLYADVMRLGRLVEDLYQLSMADLGALSYRKTAIDPVEILEDDLKALRNEFHRRDIKVTLTNRLDRIVALHADPDRLSQLFRNLLNNTLRYTDQGGKLKIRIDREGGNLVLEFQDSAPGVTEPELSRLFERFYRVEVSRSRNLGGAGLGLALCRSIVEAHNGRITARPSPFGGLGIRIDLPLEF